MSWVEDWTCRIPRLPSRDQLTLETALLHGRSLSLLPDGAPASRVHHTTPTDTLTPKKNPPPPPPPPRSPKFNVEGVRAAQMLWPRFRRDRGSTLNLGDWGEGGGRKRVGADLRLFTKLVGTWSPKGAAGPPACGNSPTWSSPGWNRGVRKIKNLLWRKHALEKSTFLFQQVVQKVGEFCEAKARQGQAKAGQQKSNPGQRGGQSTALCNKSPSPNAGELLVNCGEL